MQTNIICTPPFLSLLLYLWSCTLLLYLWSPCKVTVKANLMSFAYALHRWFGAQIIGTLLDLEPRQWRKPRRIDARQQAELIAKFRKSGWEALDWTRMLGRQDVGEGSSAGAAK